MNKGEGELPKVLAYLFCINMQKSILSLPPPNENCNGCRVENGIKTFVKSREYTCYKHFEKVLDLKLK
jgi:hypothetical protein